MKDRNIAGAAHGFESEKLSAEKTGEQVEEVTEIETKNLPREGIERDAFVKIRVNQSFFRKAVLAAYDFKCCITGLGIPELLNASRIVPWSKDEINRVNPRNGLCLNVIHDRAFDRGLLTVTPEFKIKISKSIEPNNTDSAVHDFLFQYEDSEIKIPTRFLPDVNFLKYHNNSIFKT